MPICFRQTVQVGTMACDVYRFFLFYVHETML